MKVAIVHDWLTVSVVQRNFWQEVMKCFPSADLFTTVDFLPGKFSGFSSRQICPDNIYSKNAIRAQVLSSLSPLNAAGNRTIGSVRL